MPESDDEEHDLTQQPHDDPSFDDDYEAEQQIEREADPQYTDQLLPALR